MPRKLKGTLSKKLKPSQKEKMEKTLEKMDKVREADNSTLRNKLVINLKNYKEELNKAKEYIQRYKDKIEELEVNKLKLEGAIIAIGEVLGGTIESKTESTV